MTNPNCRDYYWDKVKMEIMPANCPACAKKDAILNELYVQCQIAGSIDSSYWRARLEQLFAETEAVNV